MIQLDDDEKRRLAINYEHVPDRDLIRELVRRGRFREYECNATFYKELREDDKYMDMIRHTVLHSVANQIDKDKTARPAMITERPVASQDTKSLMTASVIVLQGRPVQAVLPGE